MNQPSPGARSTFSRTIDIHRKLGCLVIQPRMGFGTIDKTIEGLRSTRQVGPNCIGTITIDSYTRVGDYSTPRRCLDGNGQLNGFPLLTHSRDQVKGVLNALEDPGFPVQIRHGTAMPQAIFQRMVEVGLDATEGGPVSYCLPYSRVPLEKSIIAWRESCNILANETEFAHIESFGGCMLGQLSPPSILITLSLLECMFFRSEGIRSVSLSYAQGTLDSQDFAAIQVLRDLASEWLRDIDWHVVMYTYMGVFPSTVYGANRLIHDSVELAKTSGCERLIIKTKVESKHIPTIEDNIESLTTACVAESRCSRRLTMTAQEAAYYEEIRQEVQLLVNTVLDLHSNIGLAIQIAFSKGFLDIPFCLHHDNPKLAQTYIDDDGALRWARVGKLPLARQLKSAQYSKGGISSDQLLNMLRYKSSQYDCGECHA